MDLESDVKCKLLQFLVISLSVVMWFFVLWGLPKDLFHVVLLLHQNNFDQTKPVTYLLSFASCYCDFLYSLVLLLLILDFHDRWWRRKFVHGHLLLRGSWWRLVKFRYGRQFRHRWHRITLHRQNKQLMTNASAFPLNFPRDSFKTPSISANSRITSGP